MSAAHQLSKVSIEEFEAMPSTEEGRLELVDGEVVRLTFPTPKHNRIERRLTRLLEDFAEPRGLGLVFSSDTGYILSREPANLRAPDISFIRAERIQETDFDRNIPGAPDLAVEIVSPGDTIDAMRKKVDQYLTAGAGAVWVLRPASREVEVFEAGRHPRLLSADDALEVSTLLPGFRVTVDEIFSDLFKLGSTEEPGA